MDYQNIFSLFRSGVGAAKYPKVTLQTKRGEVVVLKLAGSKSKYEGQIQIVDDQPFGSNRYYGRIELNGGLIGSPDITPNVEDLLQRLTADPIGTCAEIGRLTGNCVFCTKSLTDATSLAVGYGSTCAKKRSLPYKAKAGKPEPVAQPVMEPALEEVLV